VLSSSGITCRLQRILQNNTSNNDDINTEKSTSFKKAPTSHANHQDANSNTHNQDDKTATDRWIMWATIALAFFALFQVIAMILQYCSMQKQVRELKKSIDISKRATHATEKAADAAKDSVDSLRCTERAYILADVSPIDEIFPLNNAKDFSVPVEISNIGKTPAILIKSSIDTVWREDYPIKYPEYPYQFPPGVSVITAGEKETWTIPVQIHKDILSKIIDGKMKLICYGLIEYQDVWKGKHETGFCWEIIPYRDANMGYYVKSKSILVNDSPLNKCT
jgi:hypothetical protein